VTDPAQDLATGRHPEPVFQVARADAVRELKVPDEHAELKAASRGELEARVLDGYRALDTAPPDVSAALKLTSQAEADARADAAAADVRHDEAEAAQQRTLAGQLAGKAAELEQAQAARDAHDLATKTARARADLAREELAHRGYDPVLGWEPDTSDPEPDRTQDPDGYVECALRQARVHDAELAQAAREKLAQREATADAEADLIEELELLDAGEEAEPAVPSRADKYTLSIMGQHLQHGAALRGGGGGEPPGRSGGHRAPGPAADGSPFWRAGFREHPEAQVEPAGGGPGGLPGAGRDEPAPEPERRSAVDDLLARMDAELEQAQAGERERQPETEADADSKPEARAGDRAAMYAEIHEDLERIGQQIGELSAQMEAEDTRRAAAQAEAMNEPAVWQQPEIQAGPEVQAAADADTMPDMDLEAEI